MNIKTAYQFISKSWYGVIISYFIILSLLWVGIWAYIEPLDIPTSSKVIELDNIFRNRSGNQFLICIIGAPYITLLLVIINKKLHENDLPINRILYNSQTIKISDFSFGRKKSWDNTNKSNYGREGEGSFFLNNNVLSLERTNDEGVCFIDLFNYKLNGSESKCIKKDITKGGIRSFQVMFYIKLTGLGQQSIFVALKNYNSFEWLISKKIIVDNNDWAFHNFILKTKYEYDLNLRIESKDVTNPKSSIQIKDLNILEID